MKVEDIFFKEKARPYIIAEVSQNHDGSLGQAHAYIDAVADCGVDAIKFQTHIADEESTVYEPFRVPFSYEDNTRYEYWKRMEFSKDQWIGLYRHAQERKLDFLSSPFSIEALKMLNQIGIPAWKIGAGEAFNEELLECAVETGKPILISSGLCTYKDLDRIVEKIKKNQYLIFQCVTAYPSKSVEIDINQIKILKEKYGCKIGISDHSATIYPSLAATTMGANAIEVHVTMSHLMFGPDVKASVDMEQLRQIVDGSRFIYDMLNCKSNLEIRSERQNELKEIFSKSMFSNTDIKKGTTITKELFKAKKPNCGIDANDFDIYIGRRINKDLKMNEPLKREDID